MTGVTCHPFLMAAEALPEKNAKNIIFLKKSTCNVKKSMIFFKGCGMIAMKREVAAPKHRCGRFSVERMSS